MSLLCDNRRENTTSRKSFTASIKEWTSLPMPGLLTMACSQEDCSKWPQFSSVQFSPLTDWVVGGRGRLRRDHLPVFSAEDEKFPQALDLESLDSFLRDSKQGSCLTATEEEGDKRLTSTCLPSWWCCFARSCLIRLTLQLLRRSWRGFLLSRCHPCRGLLPDTWNWSPPPISGRWC